MPLTSSRGVPGRENSLRGSSSTVIQSGVSGRGRSRGEGVDPLDDQQHRHQGQQTRNQPGPVPHPPPAAYRSLYGHASPSFPQIYLYYSRVLPRRLLRFSYVLPPPPRDLPGRPDKKPPGRRRGAGLWFAEGLVEGRLYLGQKADKGDGLQCVILRRKITHCIHRDGGRLRQRVAVHPAEMAGKATVRQPCSTARVRLLR